MVDVHMVVDQERCNFILAIENRQAQSVFSVASDGVQIRAGRNQSARDLQIAFPRGEHQRRQPSTGQLVHGMVRLGRLWRCAFKAAAMRRRNEIRTYVD